ncbi:Ltp family lipoprotein [Apilactobacillus kunkeei]|uniref:Ltp family lipoprotein n=1 Tax=Apilactobacillus kunkeei TaxID=148814 RepID=UPI00333F8C56
MNWNENALKSAKTYYKDMHMSKDAVKEQLTSSYGDKFTNDEATYAVNHLN